MSPSTNHRRCRIPRHAEHLCALRRRAVVPEILEPSLQLAAAVLSSLNLKSEEISEVIDAFRRSHMADLSALSSRSGGSLGYGFDAEPRPIVAVRNACSSHRRRERRPSSHEL